MDSMTMEYVPPVMFHPGVMLAEKLEELKMPIKEFAVRSAKPEKTIHDVLKGKSSITPDMAIQFENVLKIPARFWLKMQRDFDEHLARLRQKETLKQAVGWMRKFPFADMEKKGFLPVAKAKSAAEKTQLLLEYFGIAKPEAWEGYYQKQVLCTAFRLSLMELSNQHSLSAWLRHGEIQIGSGNIGEQYSADALKKQLLKMIELANCEHPDFKPKLVELCAEVGIILVYTPHIKNSKAQGATRWVNNCPLIQISDCRKKYDIFWFSFFHEIGHILLHNKKDVFLEGIEYSEKSADKEREADSFAAELLVPKTMMERLHCINHSDAEIAEVAKETGIHPAFLVGRMHYSGILPYSLGNAFIPSVVF